MYKTPSQRIRRRFFPGTAPRPKPMLPFSVARLYTPVSWTDRQTGMQAGRVPSAKSNLPTTQMCSYKYSPLSVSVPRWKTVTDHPSWSPTQNAYCQGRSTLLNDWIHLPRKLNRHGITIQWSCLQQWKGTNYKSYMHAYGIISKWNAEWEKTRFHFIQSSTIYVTSKYTPKKTMGFVNEDQYRNTKTSIRWITMTIWTTHFLCKEEKESKKKTRIYKFVWRSVYSFLVSIPGKSSTQMNKHHISFLTSTSLFFYNFRH